MGGDAAHAELDSILAVHAENDTITAALTARARAAGTTSAADYLASRRAIAELEAINPDRAVGV